MPCLEKMKLKRTGPKNPWWIIWFVGWHRMPKVQQYGHRWRDSIYRTMRCVIFPSTSWDAGTILRNWSSGTTNGHAIVKINIWLVQSCSQIKSSPFIVTDKRRWKLGQKINVIKPQLILFTGSIMFATSWYEFNFQKIGTLLPEMGEKLMGKQVDTLKCAAPPEHAGKNLTSLAHRKLRCLDLYAARPERDAAVLVGILIGLLLAMPVALTIFVFWKKGFFFCGTQGPASFSRAFYKRASNDDVI